MGIDLIKYSWSKRLGLTAYILSISLLLLLAIDIPYVWSIQPFGSFMGEEADVIGSVMMSLPVIGTSAIFLSVGKWLYGPWSKCTTVGIILIFSHLLQNTTLAWAIYSSGSDPRETDTTVCTDCNFDYRGSFFFDGAGMAGPYIDDIIKSLGHVGIKNAHAVIREDWSDGVVLDVFNVLTLRNRDEKDTKLALRGSTGRQFNLIGYSFGALQAAQASIDYADTGREINFLVLIAAPISSEFLISLQNHPNIGNVIIVNLDGDPIFAGMSVFELAASLPKLALSFLKGRYGYIDSHFILGGKPPIGNSYRMALGKKLYEVGLR